MKINIKENPLNMDLNKLLTLGYRANNSKRNFLFISKCLGKHLIVKPEIVKLTGFMLAYQIYKQNKELLKDIVSFIEYPYNGMSNDEKLQNIYKSKVVPNESTLVLGFAETATGLGMSVASAIQDSYYITTTREPITSLKSCFDFEETHSHATSHQCFLEDVSKLNAQNIILVDDEITTGNTMLNLIESLEKNLPTNNRKYTIVSILDWRSDEQRQKFEDFSKKFKIELDMVSIISGTIENNDLRIFENDIEEEIIEITKNIDLNIFERKKYETSIGFEDYLTSTGRFGVSFDNIEKIELYAQKVAKYIEQDLNITNERILIVGHGENIFIPSRIASKFKNADFKTTSRSPIFISDENNYPIKEKSFFYDNDIKYYFYDRKFIEKYYDKVIFLTEIPLYTKLTKNCYIYNI